MNVGRRRRDHITASTIRDIQKFLRCAFNLAVRWEYINKNPFINATLPEHTEKERVVLSPEHVLRVLKFIYRPEQYDYYTMYCAILIAVGCTIRGGEIDRVSKKSMDKLSKPKILFKFPNLYPGTKTVIVLKQPKTKSSIRMVETPRIVLDALQTLKNMQEKLKTEFGTVGYMGYDLVICQANGRPIMAEHLNKRFKDILTEMNDFLENTNSMDSTHTAANARAKTVTQTLRDLSKQLRRELYREMVEVSEKFPDKPGEEMI